MRALREVGRRPRGNAAAFVSCLTASLAFGVCRPLAALLWIDPSLIAAREGAVWVGLWLARRGNGVPIPARSEAAERHLRQISCALQRACPRSPSTRLELRLDSPHGLLLLAALRWRQGGHQGFGQAMRAEPHVARRCRVRGACRDAGACVCRPRWAAPGRAAGAATAARPRGSHTRSCVVRPVAPPRRARAA